MNIRKCAPVVTAINDHSVLNALFIIKMILSLERLSYGDDGEEVDCTVLCCSGDGCL